MATLAIFVPAIPVASSKLVISTGVEAALLIGVTAAKLLRFLSSFCWGDLF
jgi:hypothetical protein